MPNITLRASEATSRILEESILNRSQTVELYTNLSDRLIKLTAYEMKKTFTKEELKICVASLSGHILQASELSKALILVRFEDCERYEGLFSSEVDFNTVSDKLKRLSESQIILFFVWCWIFWQQKSLNIEEYVK